MFNLGSQLLFQRSRMFWTVLSMASFDDNLSLLLEMVWFDELLTDHLLKDIYSKARLRRIRGNHRTANSLDKRFRAVLGLKGFVRESASIPPKVSHET
jgi:hypothetical protein